MTITSWKIWTCNLTNGLPCSNQLSYRVIWQLSGWVQVLGWAARDPAKADTKLTYSMGRMWQVRSARHRPTCSRPDCQTLTWQSDFNLTKVIENKRWEIMAWKKRGKMTQRRTPLVTWQMTCHAITNQAAFYFQKHTAINPNDSLFLSQACIHISLVIQPAQTQNRWTAKN